MPTTDPEVLAALRACKLWHAASDEAVAGLASAAVREQVARGQALAVEGEPAERFGVVVLGKARVYHMGADGRQITFENLERGDPLLAVAALAGGRHPANAEAVTDGVVAWLPRQALLDLAEAEPPVARSIIANLAGRVVHFTQVAQALALDVPARLARYLFQQALAVGQATPAGLVVDLGMSKGELAMALGTVPETLSRALGRLRDDGVLEVRGSEVVVHDVGALARLGSGYEEG